MTPAASVDGARSTSTLGRGDAGARPAGDAGGNRSFSGLPAVLLACVVLAALSLLAPSAPTYDPWAWIIWGREIMQLELSTTYGPSWKPLPVLFTAPFSLAGDQVAPALWLVVARAGGLLAIAMAFRLANRLAGPVAGLIAAAGLILADEFVRNFARGNSEGMLVAFCLLAVERHVDGHRGQAFAAALGAALLRPEVWPFFGLYGLWLVLTDRRLRIVVVAGFAATALLWFVPEYIGSGDFLRAAERARQANPGSPAHAERPFLEVLRGSSAILAPPLLVGTVIAAGFALASRRRRPGATAVLALVVAAVVLLAGVGVMTEFGFAGNLRYVALPAALICVAGAVGWVWLVRAVAARSTGAGALVASVALLASAPFAWTWGAALVDSLEQTRTEALASGDLPRAIARSGGAAAADRCGTVATGPFEVQIVAWYLDRHGREVALDPEIPGTVYARRGQSIPGASEMPVVTQTDFWTVRRRCSR